MVEAKQFLDKFMKVYSNLPIGERKLPVVVIGDDPISWKMSYLEIKHSTPLGLSIAQQLIELKII